MPGVLERQWSNEHLRWVELFLESLFSVDRIHKSRGTPSEMSNSAPPVWDSSKNRRQMPSRPGGSATVTLSARSLTRDLAPRDANPPGTDSECLWPGSLRPSALKLLPYRIFAGETLAVQTTIRSRPGRHKQRDPSRAAHGVEQRRPATNLSKSLISRG